MFIESPRALPSFTGFSRVLSGSLEWFPFGTVFDLVLPSFSAFLSNQLTKRSWDHRRKRCEGHGKGLQTEPSRKRRESKSVQGSQYAPKGNRENKKEKNQKKKRKRKKRRSRSNPLPERRLLRSIRFLCWTVPASSDVKETKSRTEIRKNKLGKTR